MTSHDIPDWETMPDRRDSVMKWTSAIVIWAGSILAGVAIGLGVTGTTYLPLLFVGVGLMALGYAIAAYRCSERATKAVFRRQRAAAWKQCSCGCEGRR